MSAVFSPKYSGCCSLFITYHLSPITDSLASVPGRCLTGLRSRAGQAPRSLAVLPVLPPPRYPHTYLSPQADDNRRKDYNGVDPPVTGSKHTCRLRTMFLHRIRLTCANEMDKTGTSPLCSHCFSSGRSLSVEERCLSPVGGEKKRAKEADGGRGRAITSVQAATSSEQECND